MLLQVGTQKQLIYLGRLQKPLPLDLSAAQPFKYRTLTSGRHLRRPRSHADASTPSGTGSSGSSAASSSADNNKADNKRDDEAPAPTPKAASAPPSDPKNGKPRQPRAPPGRRSDSSGGGGSGSWLSNLFSKLKQTNILRYVLNIAGLTLLMRFWPISSPWGPLDAPDGVVLRLAYSEFVKNVRRNDVSRVVVDGTSLSFKLRPTSQLLKSVPKELDQSKISFQTTRPPDYPTPYETMINNNVIITAVEKRPGSLLSNVLGFALAFFVLASVLNKAPFKLPGRGGAARRHGSGGANFDAAQIMFDDVAGVDEAKEELQEVVECLKDPERFSKLGARPPSGVLLIGPPGTGKTLLARAVAGEAGVPFFSTSASEFVELFVGMGALRVRELFAEARKVAPAIVFIDEIDAVAKGRDNRLRSMGNDEREQTLNQLLTELDGFDTHRDQLVICIAATNRPDVLDSALLRPGRFDRRVPVERPDRIGREQILAVHINRNHLPLDPDVDIPSLASQTAGFTGADLANLVNEAALLAGRGGRSLVARCDFDSAVLRSIAGVEKKRSILRGEEKLVVARHEAGHAIVGAAVAALVPTSNQVERISIIPRSGGALGFAYSPPTEDRALMFDTEIRGQLAVLMGGRAAEAATSAAVSTGASDDIRRATDLAQKAVGEFGLSAAVGPVSVSALAAGSSEYSMVTDGGGEVGKSVEREVRAMCEGALAVARDCVELNRKLHAALAGDLERDERIEGAALRAALLNAQVPDSLRAFVLAGKVPAKVRTQIKLEGG